MSYAYKIAAATAILAITGCSTYIQRPVVSDNIAEKVHVISTAASRRANFFADHNQQFYVCIEPQPDVRENISKAFVAGAEAGATVSDTSKQGNAKTNIALLSALATAAVPRSVALEYLRTGVFALCQQKYNQNVRDPALKVYPKLEAADLDRILDRAALIAVVEAMSATKRVKAEGAGAQSVSTEAMLGELQKMTQMIEQFRAAVKPAASDADTPDTGATTGQ